MVTSPHTVALHHISDKLTEPLPSSIEHLGRTYQLTYLNPCSLVKNFGLTETILPDTIKGIGYYAFSDVYTLTNIILSSNLKMIEEGAFNWCTELRSVYFKSDAPPEIFEDNFTHCHPELTFYYPEEYKAPGIRKNLQTGSRKRMRSQRSKQNPSHLERLKLSI